MRDSFSVGRGAAAWIAVQATRAPLDRFTYPVAKLRRANVGPNEQGFVDAFNAQMLPLTQSC